MKNLIDSLKIVETDMDLRLYSMYNVMSSC